MQKSDVFIMFYVHFYVTDEGMKNALEIVDIFFGFMKYFYNNGIKKELFG